MTDMVWPRVYPLPNALQIGPVFDMSRNCNSVNEHDSAAATRAVGAACVDEDLEDAVSRSDGHFDARSWAAVLLGPASSSLLFYLCVDVYRARTVRARPLTRLTRHAEGCVCSRSAYACKRSIRPHSRGTKRRPPGWRPVGAGDKQTYDPGGIVKVRPTATVGRIGRSAIVAACIVTVVVGGIATYHDMSGSVQAKYLVFTVISRADTAIECCSLVRLGWVASR
jgi:hypothetical protein